VSAHSYRLGIDIGGTFTDLTLFDERSGALHILKTPSVPDHPSQAVVDGLRTVTATHGVDPAAIGTFVHGTTLALNTLLQRNGATCGLLVTEGFRDLLELQRLRLPNPHELYVDKVRPLVRRRHVREVRERLLADGRVYRPLEREGVLRAAQELVDEGVTALTVCFLHAYRDNRHELEAKVLLQSHFPQLYVSLSSEIWPQQREYERALLTVINSYVGETLERYFEALEAEVAREGLGCALLSTKSNGGVMSVSSARRLPVQTLLSGPASGVRGAMFVGMLAGQERIVTFDLGGTSADIAVVDGQPSYSTENRIADFPMIMPVVDIASIGAGGGSVAWTDAQGVLKVGPRSAGAAPGPAAYDRGGEEPTLTDAYVTAGLLDPAAFLGGDMPLRRDLAEKAVGALGARLGLGVRETAESVIRVATANMYAELLPLMARQGVDPHEFALVPFGGAGPTHAFMLAREVGIRKVIVPPQPGTLCALGCLIADVQGDFVQTVHADMSALDDDSIVERYLAMSDDARAWLDAQAITPEATSFRYGADMRYRGQSFETTVELDTELYPLEVTRSVLRERLAEAFHCQYDSVYGYADPSAGVELINLRLTIIGHTPKPTPATLPRAPYPPQPAGSRRVHLSGAEETVVFQRSTLLSGHSFAGPAIVEQYDTTVYIPDGFQVTVDAYGNLIGVDKP